MVGHQDGLWTLQVGIDAIDVEVPAGLRQMIEQRIEEALETYNDTNRLKVIARSSVSIDEIFRLFNRYQGRISIFHFAGHAGGKGLQLNKDFEDNETGKASGLADLFRREVEDGILQLVFSMAAPPNPNWKASKQPAFPR